MLRPDPHDDDAPDDVWFARHNLTIPRMASQSRQSPDAAQRWSGSSAAGAHDSGLIDQAQGGPGDGPQPISSRRRAEYLASCWAAWVRLPSATAGADQTRLTALAQWLGPDRCQADLDSLAMSASRAQPPAQLVEGVEAQLVQPPRSTSTHSSYHPGSRSCVRGTTSSRRSTTAAVRESTSRRA